MTTDLRSATSPGDPGTFPSTPGDFAARWNALGFEGRADLLAMIVEGVRGAHDCWAFQHTPAAEVHRVVAEARQAAWEAGRLAGFADAVGSLEAAGFDEAAANVDGLSACVRWEAADRGH